MGAQHTPGPWKFGHLGTEALWVGPEYDALQVAQVPHDTDEARDESRANAQLIAAAPELLSALNRLAASISMSALDQAYPGEREEGISLGLDDARAAIAKATGQ